MTDPTPGSFPEYTALPGTERKLVPGSEVVGPVDPSELVSVSIRLRSRAPSSDLEARVNALGVQPIGARTYLTQEQFAEAYGADLADIESVSAFAREHHLQVTRTDQAQRVVEVSGTAEAISSAFDVKLIHYSSPSGHYRGRLGPVHVP